jgi:hypothetical protein
MQPGHGCSRLCFKQPGHGVCQVGFLSSPAMVCVPCRCDVDVVSMFYLIMMSGVGAMFMIDVCMLL